MTQWEERSVETVSIRAHSSFRIYLEYTPKKSKSEESNLELHAQSFYLLFEIRSKRDYGEIGLFCRAKTCQSRLSVTPSIHYHNCVPGGSFTHSMVISNEVGNPESGSTLGAAGVSRGDRVLGVVAELRVPDAGVAGIGGVAAIADANSARDRRYRLFYRHSGKRGDFHPRDVHRPHDAQRVSELRGGRQHRRQSAAVSPMLRKNRPDFGHS